MEELRRPERQASVMSYARRALGFRRRDVAGSGRAVPRRGELRTLVRDGGVSRELRALVRDGVVFGEQ